MRWGAHVEGESHQYAGREADEDERLRLCWDRQFENAMIETFKNTVQWRRLGLTWRLKTWRELSC